jgi:hypothetical protein
LNKEIKGRRNERTLEGGKGRMVEGGNKERTIEGREEIIQKKRKRKQRNNDKMKGKRKN